MAKERTTTLTLRLPESVHALLEEVASRERRSKANMTEVMIVSYCLERGIGIGVKRTSTKAKP